MMRACEQIAEDIRTVLTSEIDPSEETLQELNERYTEAVNEVNERLRECGTLLDGGLRTEAIQKCEADPNLLELVGVLDFPEFDVWSEYIQQFGLPGPPSVFSAIAEQLNDAYNEEASLGDLLKQHRLHALLRSPLPTRLNILRALAHRDSGTPIWQEDIKAYETVRHNELRGEISDAFKRGDLKTLGLLEREVRSDAWKENPPKDIVEAAIQSHTKLRVKAARQQLEELVDKLTDAYSAFDVDRGRDLRTRWHAQAAIALSRDDDPLHELAAPALEWLDQQDHQEQKEADYQTAIDELNQALDDYLPQQELERRYYTLKSFDREIDPIVSGRLQERLLALADRARRRSRLITTGVVSMILLIGVVIGYGVYRNGKGTVLANHVSTLREHVDAGDYLAAEEFLRWLEENNREVFNNEDVQVLNSRTRGLRETEQGRRARLQQLTDSAREVGTSWEGHGGALSFLSRAEDLAKDDLERAEIGRVRAEVKATRDRLQKEYNDAFAVELSHFAGRCDAVDSTDLDAIKLLIKEGELLSQRDRVSNVLLQNVDPLVERLKSQQKAEMSSRSEAEMIAQIDRSVGRRREFQLALENYCDAFPLKPSTIRIKQVLKDETDLWDSLDAWSAFLATWNHRDYRFQEPQSAVKLIEQANEMLEQHPGFLPAETNLRNLVEYLTPITQRLDEQGRSQHLILTEKITNNIQDRNVAFVSVANEVYGYYFDVTKAPREIAGNLSLDRYVDANFVTTRIERFPRASVLNPKLPNGEFDYLSPQTKFREIALDVLSRFERNPWEQSFYELIRELDHAFEMAPQVRIQLLSLFLQVGCRGSQPMNEAYQEYMNRIQAARIPDQPLWVDPTDQLGTKSKNDADRLLRQLGFKTREDPNPIGAHISPQIVARKTAQLLASKQDVKLGERYLWVGWLRKDELAQWAVIFRPNSETDERDLFVIHRDSENRPRVTKIGMGVGDGAQFTDSQDGLLVGRPVYVIDAESQ